ncbi:hypothetical protein HK097_003643 [Rhizophlyctis rosea]|uniref:Ankyrin n=1 Tax=Rhizophlyctis rosea TaxID=64517 RepID=A0AAD5S2A0_9FUNG|nr:hypothetical protein HK097_003643 [Rhizophlyctis rosea]
MRSPIILDTDCMREIARISHPQTCLTIRQTNRELSKWITTDDITISELRWRLQSFSFATVFEWAVTENRTKFLKLLLKIPLPPKWESTDQYIPKWMAFKIEDSDQTGADLMLSLSIHYNHLPAFNLLLTSPTYTSNWALNNALIIAASEGKYQMTQALLQQGANPREENHHALLYAAYGSQPHVLALVFKTWFKLRPPNGISPTDIDHDVVDNILKWASQLGCSDVVESLIIECEASPEARTLALKYAARWGQLDILNFLLQNGADVRAGNAPLIAAVEKGQNEVVDILIKAGMEVEDSMMELALKEGHLKTVEVLHANGWPLPNRQ